MSRWLWPMAAGALLALGALLAVFLLAPPRPASQADVARSIAQELRCPDCEGLSVADSSSQAAAEIRSQISAQLAAGRTPDQVRQSFVDRYGDWILLAPASPLLWIAPGVVLVIGLVLLAVWLARRRAATPPERAATSGTGDGAADGLRARVRDEAEALDA
jgi:cytochrome c-type biogenesis protein CcmH